MFTRVYIPGCYVCVFKGVACVSRQRQRATGRQRGGWGVCVWCGCAVCKQDNEQEKQKERHTRRRVCIHCLFLSFGLHGHFPMFPVFLAMHIEDYILTMMYLFSLRVYKKNTNRGGHILFNYICMDLSLPSGQRPRGQRGSITTSQSCTLRPWRHSRPWERKAWLESWECVSMPWNCTGADAVMRIIGRQEL